MLLYTIGHSNHTIDKFIGLLQGQAITRLVDVRSTPYSRFNPQFNKQALGQSLAEHGIQYRYLGESLGGRPTDPSCYIHGTIPQKIADSYREVDYAAVMQRPWFVAGIQALLELASQAPTCIMCSEKDPAMCHRHHLITRYLLETHPEVNIQHILADGNLVDAALIVT